MTASLLGVVSLLSSAPAALAQDTFTCRASVVRVVGEGPTAPLGTIEPLVSSENADDCTTEQSGVLNDFAIPGELGELNVVFANTDAGGSAAAGVFGATITLPGAPVIGVELLTAATGVDCTSGSPQFFSRTRVVGLTIDGTEIQVPPGHFEVPLGPLGTLHLNEVTTTEDQITAQALFLDTIVGDVVIAEAQSDFHGNPCKGGTGEEICGNGKDDDDDGQIDENCPPGEEICGNGIDDDKDGKVDEGCPPGKEICGNGIDDDKDGKVDEGCPPGGGGDAPECSDERDNDGDGKIDFPNDPGCDSPQDDNETDSGPDPPECSDGVDNDMDGSIDYPFDRGCDSREDDSEEDDEPECSNGKDDDRDGATDGTDAGCKGPQDDDEAAGHMTGGGGYDEVDKKTAPEDIVEPGASLRYGTSMPCDLGDSPKGNLVVQFHDPGNLGRYKLVELTRAHCRNDPFIANGNNAEFDTFVGEGVAQLNGAPVQIQFEIIDRGEPGAPPVIGVDYFSVMTKPFVPMYFGRGTLDEGNNQAHTPGNVRGTGKGKASRKRSSRRTARLRSTSRR